ncbi:bifunctional folylpolyglutamate synthase/dihydrofolate synthase [Alicyclobacillus macrosporangiidus]|uniref:tetrahydrofolate synthase n=1 Tax=Alicyclobacillus macrosporangiidus TaxID=392015 RepID=A0A1I7JVW1_9BACL|nr:folylpolyglutamate synthase/dihydrofolate synthase family protein [Alicyclobacillus macrosporangiidus]SFU89245.1 dihydrofolate synthase / folylpolyglutamate synthase [Alicyclobacillus macrosporangiidus]
MAVGAPYGANWLRGLARFGMKPGLERTRRVLAALGNPHQALRFLHVAGTNGKGSVCAILTALLSARLRTATYTSPAFDGYRGRFVVDGRPIPEAVLERLSETVRQAAEAAVPGDPLTEFEALTVMAILYFHEERAEAVVWETGLGGRLDTTNVVQPAVTGITNVGFDHMDVLGNTLRQIAWEKAGILKPGVPAVTAAEGEALDVIRSRAKEIGAPLTVCGADVSATVWRRDARFQWLDYRGLDADGLQLPLPLFGDHQRKNAAVALAMYEWACRAGVCPRLSIRELREALMRVRWPGRFEVFEGPPPVVLDGAHNPPGAAALARSLREFAELAGLWSGAGKDTGTPRRMGAAAGGDPGKAEQIPGGWTMVVGVLGDKSVRPMLEALLPLADRVIAAAPDSPRALPAALLAEAVRTVSPGVPVEIRPSVADALTFARTLGRPVCVWGSLYTVHEARKAMEQAEDLRM